MGDANAAGLTTRHRRRRATFSAVRVTSLQPMNGGSAAAEQMSAPTADDNGEFDKRQNGSESGQAKSKSEKRRRRNDPSDRLRY